MSAEYDKDSGRYEKLSEKNDEERNPVVRGGLGEDGEGDFDEDSDPRMIMKSLEGKKGKELKDLARKWKVTPHKKSKDFPRKDVPKPDKQLRREIHNKMLKHGGAPDAALAGPAGGSGKGARSPSSSRAPSPALELAKGDRKSRGSCASDVRPSPPKRKATATNEGDKERETIQERMGKDKRIVDIEPDGNCLYGAIAHQLQQIRFRQEHDVKTLRKLAATYMLDHKDEMQAFLRGVLEEGQSVTDYCLEVMGDAWGGELEIIALANALKCTIVVYHGDGQRYEYPDADTRDEDQFSGAELVLSYHCHQYPGGEHYNSVVQLAPRAAGGVRRVGDIGLGGAAGGATDEDEEEEESSSRDDGSGDAGSDSGGPYSDGGGNVAGPCRGGRAQGQPESLEALRGKELKDLARKWKVTPHKKSKDFPRKDVPKPDKQLRREIHNKMLKHRGAPDAVPAGPGSGKRARSPSSSRAPSPALENEAPRARARLAPEFAAAANPAAAAARARAHPRARAAPRGAAGGVADDVLHAALDDLHALRAEAQAAQEVADGARVPSSDDVRALFRLVMAMWNDRR